jgi:DNA-binding response OmpR family regulator
MDGRAGLQAAGKFKPDLIVLDIMLPGIEGLELL